MQLDSSLINALKNCQNLVVFTGAGVSAESGVPTFRDALTGLWERFDPMQLATPQAFLQDPELVWGWYEWRRQLLLKAQPNPAHLAIAKMQQLVGNFCLITQNVDNLHEQAGSTNVLHLHGSMFEPRCFDCAQPYTFSSAPEMAQEEKRTPPKCTNCSGMVRPGVVWFGEALPEQQFDLAHKAAAQADVFLAVGTSGVVQPAAMLPELALRNNATVIHVNPDASHSGRNNEYAIAAPAGVALPALLQQMQTN